MIPASYPLDRADTIWSCLNSKKTFIFFYLTSRCLQLLFVLLYLCGPQIGRCGCSVSPLFLKNLALLLLLSVSHLLRRHPGKSHTCGLTCHSLHVFLGWTSPRSAFCLNPTYLGHDSVASPRSDLLGLVSPNPCWPFAHPLCCSIAGPWKHLCWHLKFL